MHEWLMEHNSIYIIIKLIMGYAVLLLVSRLMGKKELAQYTPFDFIFIVMLSGLVEEMTYHKSTPYYEFFIAILVWVSLSRLTETLVQKSKQARQIAKGQPMFLIENGEINHQSLQKANMELEQLRHALREQGVFSLFDVKYALLEINGDVSVITYDNNRYTDFPKMVIQDGQLASEVKDSQKIKDVLKTNGYNIEDIYYAEQTNGQLEVILKGGGDNAESESKTN